MKSITKQSISLRWIIAIVILLPAGSVEAQNTPEGDTLTVYTLDPIVVSGRVDALTGLTSTASTGFVGHQDLRLRPLVREGELLETVPGMILAQHSGDGKANQFFVRGFNLDHGTDFFTQVEGMPVNLRSHAHSHGYTDLNFIVPELVDHVEYKLGNYYADIGDFGSAGGAHFRLRRRFDRPIFSVGVGDNGFQRTAAAGSKDLGSGTLLAGGEWKEYNGPWTVDQNLKKHSGMLRYTWQTGQNTFSLTTLGYANGWNPSDQIPQRAVDLGLISRFGQIDTTLVGETSRYSISGNWTRSSANSSQRLDIYGIRYNLDLLMNFTYFLDNPIKGDQLRQRDRNRRVTGLNLADLRSFSFLGKNHSITNGVQLRVDRANVSLYRARERLNYATVRADDVDQGSMSVYTEIESPWSSYFRTVAGLRGDLLRSDISSNIAANSGISTDGLVSPKLSLILAPSVTTDVYVSGGFGFHSNDGRGTVLTVDPSSGEPVSPVSPLVRSIGAEFGVRSTPLQGWRSTLAIWTVGLDSELIFIGDTGSTEPGDASRRYGVTLANFYSLLSTVTADIAISLTRSRHLGLPRGRDHVLGSMERVIASGLTWDPSEQSDGPFAALRLRHLGGYPIIEDNSKRADSSSLLNLNAGYRLGGVRVGLSILNLLDTVGSDIAYWYGSRLPGDTAAFDGVHFHPVEPRQLRLTVSVGG